MCPDEALSEDGKPLCFVLMPFGAKPNPNGGSIDFDAVYQQLVRPAIVDAAMEPIRADEEKLGGIIHKPMFERLILCRYAVADLTTANANVFYELGVRHGIRPHTTVSLFAEGTRLPFDVAFLRSVPYRLSGGRPGNPVADVPVIADALRAAKKDTTDSPVYQLVDLPVPDISRLKTDVFREHVAYAEDVKRALSEARRRGPDAIDSVREQMGPLADVEAGVVVDLMLSYRAVNAHEKMVEVAEEMSEPVQRSVLVREQLGFALNRLGQSERAEEVLLAVIAEHGPSSETYGLLGRVYKDRWDEARHRNPIIAAGELKKAIEAYRRGFEADWRDAYPGINAVTLMELAQPPDPQRIELLPVVKYSSMRRIAQGTPDYWDHATLLELAVLSWDEEAAFAHTADAVAAVREVWEPETTLRNLRLIAEARTERDEATDWLEQIEEALETKMEELGGG
jgi:tetratricopeptide (TPR) repeat protein